MKLSFNPRSWHAWLSVVLALPLFIVAMTTFFMAHERELGLKGIAWGAEPQELKDILYTTGGVRMFVTKSGVYRLVHGRPEPVPALQGLEIRQLESLPDGHILAAGKNGLWMGTQGAQWRRIHPGDIHALRISTDGGWHILPKETTPLVSLDQGLNWRPDKATLKVLKTLPPGHADLGKLVHDLHTGEAIFGKGGEWIWIDVLGFVLVFLCLTGVWVWWKTQQRKG